MKPSLSIPQASLISGHIMNESGVKSPRYYLVPLCPFIDRCWFQVILLQMFHAFNEQGRSALPDPGAGTLLCYDPPTRSEFLGPQIIRIHQRLCPCEVPRCLGCSKMGLAGQIQATGESLGPSETLFVHLGNAGTNACLKGIVRPQ